MPLLLARVLALISPPSRPHLAPISPLARYLPAWQVTAAREEAVEQLDAHVASRSDVDTQVGALLAAQQKNVNYIEELDERLAIEQATREEQGRLITQLQASLTERTTREAASAQRAAEAETALAALKREARALRMAVRSEAMKRCVAATQTEAHVAGPQASVQTEWQAVHMPLPALPHGGTLLPKGAK